MLREILRSAITAKRKGAGFKERFSIFTDLLSLKYKLKTVGKTGNSETKMNLAGYKISGFNYYLLDALYHEIFLTDDYRFDPAKPNPVIIDCGANVGFSVLFFKKFYPQSKIFAFEPNPNSFGLLEKNIKQNNLSDVNIYNAALSDKDGHISFYVDDSDKGTLTGSLRKDRGGETELKVKAVKLSDFIKNLNTEIDLIKIDVEGAEVSIIEDFYLTGALKGVKQVIVEYHHRINNEKGRLSDFLYKFETMGFDYNIKTTYNHLGDFQDILIKFYR